VIGRLVMAQGDLRLRSRQRIGGAGSPVPYESLPYKAVARSEQKPGLPSAAAVTITPVRPGPLHALLGGTARPGAARAFRARFEQLTRAPAFATVCSSVATSVHVPSVLVGVKPGADAAQGLRRAQRAGNPNGARPVQPSNHHVNPRAFLIASSNA